MASDGDPVGHDLSLATSDELSAELIRRFEPCIIAFNEPEKVGTCTCPVVRFGGGVLPALGLALTAQRLLEKDICGQMRRVSTEDEE